MTSQFQKADLYSLVTTALLILLLVIAPFYTQPNAGPSGLGLPYNIPQWAIAAWLISLALLLITKTKTLYLPKTYHLFIIFPLVIIFSSLLADIVDPTTWLFRQCYILGGFLFLFSLFQFQLKTDQIERILTLFIFALALHSTIGIYQVVTPSQPLAWFPPATDGIPRGMFEQINVHASYLVTGMVTSIYLVSRPYFRSVSIFTKIAFLTSFGLSTYIVIYSGSRIGLLSLVLGISLVLISRRKQLYAQKTMLALFLVAAVSASLIAQEGFDRTLDKTVKISEGEYSSARLSMYSIGLELAEQEPLHGHGIGSFLRIWNLQAAEFLERNPNASLPNYVNHPHNELLFWLIEGGVPALIGIFAVIAGLLITLFRCGFQRGGGYAAMLIPISLHTQVETPFYTSAVHWFLWLFLIFIALQHKHKQVHVSLSQSAEKLLQTIALFFSIGITYFMVHCDRSQSDIFNYLYNSQAKPPYLQIARDNLYFSPLANKVAIQSLLHASIKSNDKEKVLGYLPWAENYIKAAPEPDIYSDIAVISTYLKINKKACELVTEGAQMYPRYEELQESAALCLINMNMNSN